MCQIIKLKNGNELKTIHDFENYFEVDANNYKEDFYDGKLLPEHCICFINLEQFFQDRINFEFCGLYWQEK